MVSVKYDCRIIIDNSFFQWLKSQPFRIRVISQLMRIKSSSKDFRKEHNVILKSESEICEQQNYLKNVRAPCKVIEDPDFLEQYDNSIAKNIIFAVKLGGDKHPYRCYIFTSPDKLSSYNKDPHYEKVKSVTVKSGDTAVTIIKAYYDAFIEAREKERERYQL